MNVLKADGERRKANQRHEIKLRKLKDCKKDAANKDDATASIKVVNLSSEELNNEELNILKKGLGFAIAPRLSP